jgi:hypothetical protein
MEVASPARKYFHTEKFPDLEQKAEKATRGLLWAEALIAPTSMLGLDESFE